MTVETWLNPVSDESPSGPNLEYDADFLRLEEAARDRPDQEFGKEGGDAIRIEGANADWSEVRTLAEALLARSKDLRVAVYLTRALLHTEGFSGISDGIALIQGLLENFWEGVHPELDADDDDDPTMRVNALVPLGSMDAVVGDLRASFVMRSRNRGQITVREIEIAQGRLQPGADMAVLSATQLAGLLAAAVEEVPGLPAQAGAALAGVKEIGRFISERVGESFAPDLKLLQTVLHNVVQALGLVSPEGGETPDEGDAQVSAGGGGASRGNSTPGEIRSRQDVVQTLGRLCDYLVLNEPTNPVQLVLRRAQRMMSMSFLELMEDLAPDGLTQAETVVGEKLNKDEE